MLVKHTEQLTFVVLVQNASGIALEQQNAKTMFAPPMQQMPHAHPMLNAYGQHLLHHVQQMLAPFKPTQQSVELNQHASGLEPTVSRIHAKFMLLIHHAMLKPNVSGMLQPNVRQMFAQTMQQMLHALLM